MVYTVRFQYRPKGETRPRALASPFDTAVLSAGLIPSPGDHVEIGAADTLIRYVETRLFTYSAEGGGSCVVNVVLTDSEIVSRADLIGADA